MRAEIQEFEPLQKREVLGLLVAEMEEFENVELDEVWRKAAQRRFQELKDGFVLGIPAEPVNDSV